MNVVVGFVPAILMGAFIGIVGFSLVLTNAFPREAPTIGMRRVLFFTFLYAWSAFCTGWLLNAHDPSREFILNLLKDEFAVREYHALIMFFVAFMTMVLSSTFLSLALEYYIRRIRKKAVLAKS